MVDNKWSKEELTHHGENSIDIHPLPPQLPRQELISQHLGGHNVPDQISPIAMVDKLLHQVHLEKPTPMYC